MNAKSNAYQTETSEHASSEMFLPSRLNALREQLLRADEKNAELERERKAKKEEEKLAEAHTRELERELKFMRELNAKMTNDFIEVEAGRMRLRAEVDRLLFNEQRKEKTLQVLKEEVERKAETNAREMQDQMEKEKEKLRGMMDGDALVNALMGKLFAKDEEEELEEGASSPTKAGEEDERSERLRFHRASFEHTQTAKLVSDLESQLVLANKRLFECEKFQFETDSQLVKDKAELATAVARLQSFVERLSTAEKTKDDEIARLRQKRRALEKELDDLSLELENFKTKASSSAKCERKSMSS
ncbi:unknown protein [Bathycoccus prasinos]|uniref:Uncharacterized protein n=1 Tax=Bathycoccus prasinos TaxID=41875 RepID=K8FA38_9CHLO|nr:unknown protein [Bathycoccus prasinos]CCO18463.1 unknown protein [Bathycoccus prasinos]|eukprot:XP_007510118.1 unknown protein [Bathycoccus prasinos]